MKRNLFKVMVSDTLNRGVVVTSFPNRNPLNFVIMFNKKTSALEAQYDTRNPMIIDGTVKVRLHRNLNNCLFSNIFFELESIDNKQKDYRTRFVGVNPRYREVILQFFSEKLDLKVSNESKSRDHSNYLMISGWKLYDHDESLIFYFVQRKIFNVVQRVPIIRTMGIQFSNEQGFNVLTQFEEDFQKNKETNNGEVKLPEYLHSDEEVEKEIFEGEED